MTVTVARGGVVTGASRRLLAVSAVCAAVTVANIYLAQPIVGLIATDLGLPAGVAGWVPTVALFGYTLGILLLVPLGDVVDRRRLVRRLSLLTTVLLLGAAAAPGLPVLALLAGAAAMTTVIPQVLIPLVAQTAGAGGRAAAMAWVQAGLVAGIMLSRTVGGAVGQWLGWRAVYLLAAALTVTAGLAAARLLASDGDRPAVRYRALLGSLPRLLAAEPELRWACLRQAAVFGAFSAVWTTLALLLTGAPFHLGAGVAGLVGLLGLSGVVAAPLGGRLADRLGGAPVGMVGLAALAVLVPVLLLGGHSLPVLLVGVLLTPAAMQVGQVGNQSAALAVRPAEGARLNTAYMLATFLSGAAGSALGVAAYGRWGWPGACLTAGAFVAFGLLACAVRRVVR
ncbi:MFS transporter [Solihabitans fulvus]|uniref:MFS transporter n=1 Tax=Solihabitans fulvus TaxID=1892852 RepID=UPI001662101A|nr:MFS transporter [Solihabitans fulvus]